MTTPGRLTATATGQLPREFRGRDTSGLPPHHLAGSAELVDSLDIPSWLAGPTGAALHHFDGYALRPPFHLTIERGHNVRRIGHVIHTTDTLPLIDRAWAHGLPVLSPARTLLHLASLDSPERVTAALDSALRDGLVSEDFLHRRIAALRKSGRSGVRPLLRIIEGSEITRGGHSWLEREFLRLVALAGLPRPEPQQVLGRRRDRLIRVDCHFPGTRLVVELLGYRFHRTPQQMLVDAERLNRLQLDGFVVLQFTYRQVVEEPDRVAAHVREALSRLD
jgi:very-short-patch-repair endonuclease